MMTKLVLRGVMANKIRLGLTALAVILGVAFVAGTLIFSASMNTAVDSAFSNLGKGTDTVVRAKRALGSELGEDAKPLPDTVLKTVQGSEGVAKAQGTVQGFAAVLNKQGDLAGDPPQTGTAWIDDPDFSLLRLRNGSPPRAPNEVAIDETSAKAAGYQIGDQVRVALPSGVRTFTLSGTFRFGDGSTPNPSMAAFATGTAAQLLMENPKTFTEITVKAKEGYDETRLRDAVAKVLPEGYEAITGRKAIEEQADSVKDILGLLSRFVLAFAFISIFVGSFIIFNTFAMLVAQRTRELALLRAVGASRAQVTRAVMGEAFAIGLIGSTLGLLAGMALAAALPGLLGLFGTDMPSGGVLVTGQAVVWSYAVGMIVTMVAAYFPARRAATIPPVAALRDDIVVPGRSLRFRAIVGGTVVLVGAVMAGIGFTVSGSASMTLAGGGAALFFIGITVLNPLVSRPATRIIGWPFSRGLGLPGRLSRENAQRNPRRTAATASALMIGLTLISGVSVIAESMLSSVDKQLDAGLVADYRVTTKSITASLTQPVRDTVSKVPGVQSAVAVQTARLRLNGKIVTATAGTPQEILDLHRLKMEEGTSTLAANELLVSRSTAKDNGWKIGSSVPAEYGDGKKANSVVKGIYANIQDILETAPKTIVGLDTYRAHYPAQIDSIEIVKAPGTDDSNLRTLLQTALAPWPNVDLKDRKGIKDEYGAQIKILLQLVLALLALSVLIAALGIINTLALSVTERTREIGLLRAIGMERRDLRRMIRYEAVIISLFGSLLGMAIGVSFAALIQNAASGDGMEVLSIPVLRLGSFIFAAGVIGVFASLWPARHAAKMDILRAISTQ